MIISIKNDFQILWWKNQWTVDLRWKFKMMMIVIIFILSLRHKNINEMLKIHNTNSFNCQGAFQAGKRLGILWWVWSGDRKELGKMKSLKCLFLSFNIFCWKFLHCSMIASTQFTAFPTQIWAVSTQLKLYGS